MRRPGNARILVVADDPGLRQLLVRLLAHAGYHDVFCDAGLTGFARLRHASPPFDLVVLNSYVPERGGDVALARVRAAFPSVPLLHLEDVAQGSLFIDRFFHAVDELLVPAGALDSQGECG